MFLAMSLDGYIADREGKVDWLGGESAEGEDLDSYAEFIEGTDTVIMGWNTYHQIVTELSPDRWVYEGLTTYVLTHRDLPSSEGIRFTGEDPVQLVKRLRTEAGKGIWICGGAKLVRQLVEKDMIDRYAITILPVLLGGGIRLFESGADEIKLRLRRMRSGNGMAELVYVRR